MKRVSCAILILGLVAICPACSKGGDGASGPTTTKSSEGGAQTPQAAFDKLRDAVNKRDNRALFGMLTKQLQNQMLVGQLIGAGIAGISAALWLDDFGTPFHWVEARQVPGGTLHEVHNAIEQT